MFIPKCTPRRVGGFSFSMPIFLPEVVKERKMTKQGVVVKVSLQSVNQAKVLPDSSTTDLELLLAAGKSPDIVRAPMYGKSEVDYNQIIDNLKKEISQQTNTQNSQQTNTQNSQQTNTKKGE